MPHLRHRALLNCRKLLRPLTQTVCVRALILLARRRMPLHGLQRPGRSCKNKMCNVCPPPGARPRARMCARYISWPSRPGRRLRLMNPGAPCTGLRPRYNLWVGTTPVTLPAPFPSPNAVSPLSRALPAPTAPLAPRDLMPMAAALYATQRPLRLPHRLPHRLRPQSSPQSSLPSPAQRSARSARHHSAAGAPQLMTRHGGLPHPHHSRPRSPRRQHSACRAERLQRKRGRPGRRSRLLSPRRLLVKRARLVLGGRAQWEGRLRAPTTFWILGGLCRCSSCSRRRF